MYILVFHGLGRSEKVFVIHGLDKDAGCTLGIRGRVHRRNLSNVMPPGDS